MTVHKAELLGFSSDFRHEHKYEQRQLHYKPLVEELERAGGNVNRRVHVPAITVGARATVPEGNGGVMRELTIAEEKLRKELRKELQRELVWVSVKHAAIIRSLPRSARRTRR